MRKDHSTGRINKELNLFKMIVGAFTAITWFKICQYKLFWNGNRFYRNIQ